MGEAAQMGQLLVVARCGPIVLDSLDSKTSGLPCSLKQGYSRVTRWNRNIDGSRVVDPD
jgi:hypothetical protein